MVPRPARFDLRPPRRRSTRKRSSRITLSGHLTCGFANVASTDFTRVDAALQLPWDSRMKGKTRGHDARPVDDQTRRAERLHPWLQALTPLERARQGVQG